MTELTVDAVKNKLFGLNLPDLDILLKPEQVRVQVKDNQIDLNITLPIPFKPFESSIITTLVEHCKAHWPHDVNVRLSMRVGRYAVQPGCQSKLGVKNIIAVMSGKGGVGKSTIATLLARALHDCGAKVGLADADIYGPSIPSLFDTTGTRPKIDSKRLYPIEVGGIATVSMGHLVEEQSPMIWRGPMATQALVQLVNDTAWPELDYLIIDMPPGTGDIALSLAQKVPLSGTVMVTTAQDLALGDVRRAIAMCQKLNLPLLGIVENLAQFECPQCHHCEPLFGKHSVKNFATQNNTSLLERIPYQRDCQDLAKHQHIQPFWPLALKVARELSLRPTQMEQVSLGKVVVQS